MSVVFKKFQARQMHIFRNIIVGDRHANIVNNSIFQILLADPPRILHSGIIINLNDCRRNIDDLSKELLMQLYRPDSAKNRKSDINLSISCSVHRMDNLPSNE